MNEQAGSFFSRLFQQVGATFGIPEFDATANEPRLVRARERYRRALISGTSAVFSRLVWIITLLISIPLTVNYLGPERYGMWMTISSLIALLQFADLGIGYGLLNAVAEASGRDDPGEAKKYISSGFFCLLGFSLLIGIVFFFLYPVIPWEAVYNVSSSQAIAEAGQATAFFAAIFLANIPLSVVGKVQQGYQKGHIDSMWQAIGRILGLAFLLIVIWMQLGLPWLVLAVAGSPVLAQWVNFTVHFLFKNPEIRPSLSQIKKDAVRLVLSTGFLFFMLQLVIAVAFAADTIVLAQLIGPEAIATYTVAFQVFLFMPTLVRVLLSPLWPAYGEATSRGDYEWAEKTFLRSIKVSLLVTGLVAAFLVLFGAKLIELWAGPEVVPPAILLVSLGINSILLYGWGDPVAMYLNGTGKVAFEVSWAVPMALANIVLSIILTQRIGISGVAWGTSISYFFLMVIPTTLFMKRGGNLKISKGPMSNSAATLSELNTQDAAVLLRKNPDYQDLIRDSYLGNDIEDSANRFYESAEFGEVLGLLGKDLTTRKVLDLGSGIGIAASAFSRNGAKEVIALDPDLGDQIGIGAALKLSRNLPFRIAAALGEYLPIKSGTFDIVYSRQVLHHAGNLEKMVGEIYRVLRPGGYMLSTREHVVDNERQLEQFLADHPVHQLAGGENAFKLSDYLEAIQSTGFVLERVLRPWDSVINAFPNVRSQSELRELPRTLLCEKLGKFGLLISYFPGAISLIWFYLQRRRKPGRMYSFMARKRS